MRHSLTISAVIGTLGFAAPAGAADFKKDVLPILEAKCMKCHRPPYKTSTGRTKKPKGDLIMSTVEGMKAGGENGDSFKGGDLKGSLSWERVNLDPDHDDFMPPTDKADPLTEAELKALKEWIEAGADYGDWKETKFDDEGNIVKE